jgi:L-amino acid N-acyltransferase YncA
MILRAANTNDLPAITAIYNDAVLNSTATFDIVNKTLADMQIWLNHT